MSIPFEIPIINQDVVNGVSYTGSTLTLTRAEGSDLTTTITTSDPTKIENGTSSMEIASSNGDCVFTPNGDAALTTTFAADGSITSNGALTIENAFTQVGGGDNDFVSFRSGRQILSRKGFYEKYEVSGDGGGVANPRLYLEGNNSTATDNKMLLVVTGSVQASVQVLANGVVLTSDDRIKENEKPIVNATETLSKLKPQTYDKYENMDLSGSFGLESGLIAQEVYYNAPELRHLVVVGKDYDTSGNDITPTPEEMDLSDVDIANDPDYGSHGWSKSEQSGLHYQGLIAYLIKSNQELAERLAALENK